MEGELRGCLWGCLWGVFGNVSGVFLGMSRVCLRAVDNVIQCVPGLAADVF